MPKVIVYRGSLAIKANRRHEETPFYDVEKLIYAETIGALMDAIVAESVVMAQNLKVFLRKEMPVGYRMPEDYWSLSYSHPSILEEAVIGEERDGGGGSSIKTVKDVVLTTAHCRHMSFANAMSSLDSTRRQMKLPAFGEDKYSFIEAYRLRNLDEIPALGTSGVEIDKRLAVAEADGSLAQYRKELSNMRYYAELRRKERVREADKERSQIEKKAKKSLFSFGR